MSVHEDDTMTQPRPKEELKDCSETTTGIEHNDTKPKHVSAKLWEKFKALEKRTDDATRRSTEKRMKHLRNDITSKLQEHPDVRVDCVMGQAVLPGASVHSELSGSSSHSSCQTVDKNIADSDRVTDITSSQLKQWSDVKKHLTARNPAENNSAGGKTRLELQIETALNKGDYSLADELSDQLANRQFGEKIAHAFDAREFLKRKKEEEARHQAKRKKKLNWGFEHKQRWESKSNM